MNTSRCRTLASTIAISRFDDDDYGIVRWAGGAVEQHTPSGSQTYQLVWSDDFNGADGSAPDASKWAIQTGGDGWGNNELESYTARPQNVQVSGGNLVITAIKEDYTGSDGIPRHYTSARMQTKGLFSQQYGRFEARIKIPEGPGHVAGVLDAGQQH